MYKINFIGYGAYYAGLKVQNITGCMQCNYTRSYFQQLNEHYLAAIYFLREIKRYNKIVGYFLIFQQLLF